VPVIVLGLATKPLATGSLSRSIAITGMLVVAPVGSSPAEFSAVITAELPKWAKVIREAGIRLD
jgi:hypothetical protein